MSEPICSCNPSAWNAYLSRLQCAVHGPDIIRQEKEQEAALRPMKAVPELLAAAKRAYQGLCNLVEFRILRDEDKRDVARSIADQLMRAIAAAEGKDGL